MNWLQINQGKKKNAVDFSSHSDFEGVEILLLLLLLFIILKYYV